MSYNSAGNLERLRLGNGRWEHGQFNSRQQLTQLALGASATDASLWKLNYEYGEIQPNGTIDAAKNTGAIAKQTISFAGLAAPFVQTYKYDSLSRVTEAKETINDQQTWKQRFVFSRYGNRTGFTQDIGGQQLQSNSLTLPNIDENTNRFVARQGYTYDKNGNLLNDATNGGRQVVFNGDNKQTEVKNSDGVTIGTYFYDGEGKRIKKVTDAETTIFVYADGKLVAEYSSQTPTNPTINYVATDTLQSVRAISDSYGQIVSRRDFMPFGEELYADGQNRTTKGGYSLSGEDAVRQRFTGYQKDIETGFDFAEARYYNNSHGRFAAVDPLLASGKNANPQTFNRYAYVVNSPLNLTDKTGMQIDDGIVIRIHTFVCRNGGFTCQPPPITINRSVSYNGQTARWKEYLPSNLSQLAGFPLGKSNDDFSPGSLEDSIVNLPRTVLSGVESVSNQIKETAYNLAPDFVQGSVNLPVVGGIELNFSKDLVLNLGYATKNFANPQGELGGLISLAKTLRPKFGLNFGVGYFLDYNRSQMTEAERADYISGGGLTVNAPIIPVSIQTPTNGEGLTGVQPNALIINTPTSVGVSVSSSDQIGDFKRFAPRLFFRTCYFQRCGNQ